MVFDRLVIHLHTNKIFEEQAAFLHTIDAGVRSIFLCIEYLRGFCGAHYYILENFVSLLF